MLQMDNLNKIREFREMFIELASYSIDVTVYQNMLEDIVVGYETKKKEASEAKEISLDLKGNSEMQLAVDLGKLEYNMAPYCLFLELMHATKTWDFNEDIDSMFELLHGMVDHKLLDKFYQISLQELIVEKYHQLILMKIMQDYEKGECEYLEQYRNLRKHPYLKDSVNKLLNEKKIESLINSFDLEEVLKTVVKKEALPVVVESSRTVHLNIFNLANIKKNISSFFQGNQKWSTKDFIEAYNSGREDFEGEDLSDVDFTDLFISNLNLKGTKAKINLQTVKNKNLYYGNFEGLDFSDACFDGVCISNANLKGTKAKINLQKIRDKNCYGSNLEGLDLSDACFDDVLLCWTNLKDTNANIDPQVIRNCSLHCCDLENIDLSNVNFDNVDLEYTNLKNTGSFINPLEIKFDRSMGGYYKTCLEGCYVLNRFSSWSDEAMPKLEGAILIDSMEEFMELKNSEKHGFCLTKKNPK